MDSTLIELSQRESARSSRLELWIGEILLASVWVSLLVWQRTTTGLSLGLLTLGLSLAPLHLLRLRGGGGQLVWPSFLAEFTVASLFVFDPESSLLLGVSLAFMVYGWWPRAQLAPPAAAWRPVQRGLFVGGGLVYLVYLWYGLEHGTALFGLCFLALEAHWGPPPGRDAVLTRASAVLGLIVSFSPGVSESPWVTLLLCGFVSETIWLRDLSPRGHEDRSGQPQGGKLAAWRAVAVGVYLQSLNGALIVLGGFGLCLAALPLVAYPACARAPRRVISVSVATLWLLEGLAAGLGFSPTPLLTERHYMSRYGDVNTAGVDSRSVRFVVHGVEHRADSRGFRWQPQSPPEPVEVVLIGDDAVFGLGVGHDETLQRQLEGHLRALGVHGAIHCYGFLGGNYASAEHFISRASSAHPQAALVWVVRDDDLLTQRFARVDSSDQSGALPFPRYTLAPLWRTRLGALLAAPYDASLRWLGVRDSYYTNVLETHSEETYRFGQAVWRCTLDRRNAKLSPLWVLVLPTHAPSEQRRKVQAHLEKVAEVARARIVPTESIKRLGSVGWLPWEPDLPSAGGQRALAAAIGEALLPTLREQEPQPTSHTDDRSQGR